MAFATAKPVEASVHQLHFLLDYGVVEDAVSGGGVSLDRVWRLGPSHFYQLLTERDPFICGDVQATKFGFSGGDRDKLDNLGNGENGFIVARELIVFRK